MTIRVTVGLFLIMAAVSASWAQSAADSARQELTRRGIPFTDDSFAKYVREGDADVVNLFLAAGADANARSSDGDPLIVVAATKGRRKIAERLLAAGARPQSLLQHTIEESSGVDWEALISNASSLSGVMIALVGLLFTHVFNKRGKRLQELETVQKLIPYLAGREDERAAALVAVAHLSTPDVAASFAGLKPDKASAVACIELLQNDRVHNPRPLRAVLRLVFLEAAKGERRYSKSSERKSGCSYVEGCFHG